MTKYITILGATGSIGCSTLDVVARHPDKFKIYALTAKQNFELLLQQCIQFEPKIAVLVDDDSATQLQDKLKQTSCNTIVMSGSQALCDVASEAEVDYVVAAIVGAAGLLPTIAAAKTAKRVLLANKEVLVMSGQLFMNAVEDNNTELMPVDSEHNAIFQCLPADKNMTDGWHEIDRILLTASGGPFRNMSLDQLVDVSPDEACVHPNWNMGRKISVDSATMMNKGLELIEACWLFNTSSDNIQIVVHPESIIHSLVAYIDGSVLAQLGQPDMRTCISYGLAFPDRIKSGVEQLDLMKIAQLNFSYPDEVRFPALRIAREAVQQGGTSCAILNAANEVAVEAFLAEKLRFTDITKVVEQVMKKTSYHDDSSIDIVIQDDQNARHCTLEIIQTI